MNVTVPGSKMTQKPSTMSQQQLHQQQHSIPPLPPNHHQQLQQQPLLQQGTKLKSLTDDHAIPQHNLTHVQVTLLVVYGVIFLLWLTRTICTVFNIKIFNSHSFSLSPFRQSNTSKKTSLSEKEVLKSELESLHSTVTITDNDVKNEINLSNVKDLQNNSDKIHNLQTFSDASDKSQKKTDKSVGYSNNKNISAIISISQNGVTENLNERHFDSYNNSSNRDVSGAVSEKENGGDDLRNSPSRGDNKSKSLSSSTSSSSEPIKSPAAATSSAPPPVTFDKFLNSITLFGIIMIFFYFCDYWKMFPQGERVYSRDQFLFLVFLFFLVASVFTIKDNPDKVLNREQTEEWKGWMQVMFVWYHYFRAAEWYNWIRVYIACYVWMTGFGNFSFFWIRKDFSLWRMIKMLFRLNFLVVFVAMVTDNEYMLYYICAMHTYWFFTVYVFMRVLQSWNTDRYKMAAKFIAYAICNAVIFDIPGVSLQVFRPFKFVLGLHDAQGKKDIMHEWSFRAGLDHWVCFIGMLCAYNYPHFEAFMAYLDSKSTSTREQVKKMGIRTSLALVALLVGLLWNQTIVTKEKYAYNAQHPYTSGIPILVFIVLRNIHPVLRSKHIGLFSWLGKVTLETYLSQLHIYLLSNARSRLLYLPDYPLLNFALATIVYLTASHLLFNITNDASSYLIPRDRKRLVVHVVCMVGLFGVASAMAYGVVL